jgi:RecA-family ATPase
MTRFKLLGPAELNNLPEPSWLIEGILPANALGVLYGAPGVGKTFVALSIALSIAAGHSWCGKLTKSGSVLYVAAEGVSGMRLRVQAYQRRHGIFAEQIRYLGDVFDLRRMAEIEELISTLKTANFRPDLIVLDTWALAQNAVHPIPEGTVDDGLNAASTALSRRISGVIMILPADCDSQPAGK